MKKNILTIIIMAIVLVNTALTALLIFTIVPAAQRTTKLVDKVASIVDLELESPDSEDAVSVADYKPYNITDKFIVKLVSNDGKDHYATFTASLSENMKHKDFETLDPTVDLNVNTIKEIITDEFSKHTVDEVNNNKDAIRKDILTAIQKYFKSDFIVNVSFGNIILQ